MSVCKCGMAFFSPQEYCSDYCDMLSRELEQEEQRQYEQQMIEERITMSTFIETLVAMIQNNATEDELLDLLSLDKEAYYVKSLMNEKWREYLIGDCCGEAYRIADPILLVTREGGTTHRVIDSGGITHCVVGPAGGVVVRWLVTDGLSPVSF